AVLVWVLAEGESLSSASIEVPVVIAAGAGGDAVIEPAAGWPGRVFVDIEGSTRVIAAARDRLRGGITLRPGDPAVPAEPGEHTVDLLEALRASDALTGTVSLRSVEPESVNVLVERMDEVNAEVVVRMPDDASATAVIAEPRTVRLVYPSAAAEAVDEGLTVLAVPSPDQVAALPVGRRSTIRDVPLRLPEALGGMRFVRLDPPAISVSATIETRTDSITLDAVPVQIQRPAFQSERWRVLIEPADQLLAGVVVTGPSDQIDRIRRGELAVFAVVRLTPDDLDRRITQAPVSFAQYPTGLSFESGDATVRLRIEPYSADESPPDEPGPG
ncbi:MAG: hypothetical protein AAGF47_09955, partial [Planctomycetota bacterium]